MNTSQAANTRKPKRSFATCFQSSPNDAIVSRQLRIIYYEQNSELCKPFLCLKSNQIRTRMIRLYSLAWGFSTQFRDYQHAREAALRVEKEPGQEEALLLLVETAMGPNEFEDTRSLIHTLQAKDQQRSGYHVALAASICAKKDDVRAEAELERSIELGSALESHGHMISGNIYWARNDLKAADRAFKTAAEFAPLRSDIRMRYADFKFRTGTVADAKIFLEDLNQKAPDYLPPRVRLMVLICAGRTRIVLRKLRIF